MTVELYNQANEVIGKTELADGVFGVKWNPDLVHQVLRAQLANRRKPWAHAKGRGEVRGGGKKPWRQKGTGRARHGSTRSPIWAHGGVSHGPQKERDYSQKINKKMRRLAIFSLLSKKLAEKNLKIIDDLGVSEPKTKVVYGMIKNFSPNKKLSFLIIPREKEKNIFRASKNIEKVAAIAPTALNVSALLKHKTVLVDKDAVKIIEGHYKL